MVTLTKAQLKRGMDRYRAGGKPWPEHAGGVDWFIELDNGEHFPLKYTYGLATDQQPSLLTTNQMKRRLQHLNLRFVSRKANAAEAVEFERKVEAARKDKKGRAKRLAARRPLTQQSILQTVFNRSPDVVAEVLEQAKGYCKDCKEFAPFITAKTKRPYLEVHHIKTLASGGADTVANAIALCPNCHRKRHYG